MVIVVSSGKRARSYRSKSLSINNVSSCDFCVSCGENVYPMVPVNGILIE